MRSSEVASPDAGAFHRTSSVGSPPKDSVWSTERRLLHKQAPGAPKKKSRTYLPFSSSYAENETLPNSRKRNHDRLLLPSSTIDEDDGSPIVALSFRPTRLSFSPRKDPTTVILAPSTWSSATSSSWGDDDDDDLVVSPRLFRFGEVKLAHFEAVMVAKDDESETIFRPRDDEEGKVDDCENQDRCPFSATFRNDERDDDDRDD